MPQRKSPGHTPGSLAARRLNARKSTGPRSAAGKARASLNALKDGRHARGLAEKLRAAALYHSIKLSADTAFGIQDRRDAYWAEHISPLAYVMARPARQLNS